MLTAHQSTSAACIHTLHLPQVPASSCWQLLPLPAAGFVPEPLWPKEIPQVHHSHPTLLQPSPPDFFTSQGKLAQQTLWAKTALSLAYLPVELEEEEDKGRAVLFLHSCPCFQTDNSLFALLPSTTFLYLLPFSQQFIPLHIHTQFCSGPTQCSRTFQSPDCTG